MKERRVFTRIEMYAGVFMTRGEEAWLSEVSNVSAGGASIRRPDKWRGNAGDRYNLYFLLQHDRILCIKGVVTHEHDDTIGFQFEAGYAIQAEELLAESRNWN